MTKQTPSSLLLVATISGGIGFVAFVALMVVGGFTVSPAAFLAIVVALGAAIFLFQGFHRSSPADRPDLKSVGTSEFGDVTRKPGGLGREPGTAGVPPGSAGPRTIPATPSGTIDRPLGADDTGNAAGGAPRPELGGMPDPAAGDVARKEPDRGVHAGEGHRDDARPATETGADPTVTAAPRATSPAPEDRDGADPAPEERETDVSAQEHADHPVEEDAGPAPDEAAGDRKWSSSQLEGSRELSERKGTWRYTPQEGDASAAAASDEETVIGTEPALLSGPRDGSGDDLKRISGIGPKLESMLHHLGIYHFDQIAGWSDGEIAWIDERLEGFRGRVRRDEWVRQAGELSGRGPAPA